ncbi:hypothetical protein QP296_27035, partial [Escherichia coli]|nr:hypothetical protein [Escherichia coli]
MGVDKQKLRGGGKNVVDFLAKTHLAAETLQLAVRFVEILRAIHPAHRGTCRVHRPVRVQG